jgi:hypothetical protein
MPKPWAAFTPGSPAATLAGQRYSKEYEARLKLAREVLEKWLERGIVGDLVWEDLQRRATADKVLRTFVDWAYERNWKYSAVVHVILSVQRSFRQLRRNLPGAWERMWTWKMLMPVRSRTPMPPRIMAAMVTMGLLQGFVFDTPNAARWIAGSILIRTGFKGLLRPREVGELRIENVLVPRGARGVGKSVVVRLERPKNRRSYGRVQYSMISDPWVVAWVTWLTADAPRSLHILPGGTVSLRRVIKDLARLLHVEDLGLLASSLRSGGATERIEATGNVPLLCHLGRWKSVSSLEVYLQEAVSYLIQQETTAEADELVERLVSFGKVFDVPPAKPWQRFFSRGRQIRMASLAMTRSLQRRGVVF